MHLGSIRINKQILNNSKQMKCREIQEMMMMTMMMMVVVVICAQLRHPCKCHSPRRCQEVPGD